MLILEHGKVGDRLKAFCCEGCGCRWLAGPAEYEAEGDGSVWCRCPDCGDLARAGEGQTSLLEDT